MMVRIVRLSLLTLLLALLIMPSEVAASGAKAAQIQPALLDSLRQGGYVLYVRHGEATEGEDGQIVNFGDCSTQRNLSESGRRQATAYGEALRSLRIPVQTPVAASPFCRTRETAALAFGENNMRVDPFWNAVYRLSGRASALEQAETLAALTSRLEEKPAPGKNRVIVAHSFPRGIGLGDIPYMGTVVVKPEGAGGGYTVIARISLEELARLP